MLSFWFVIVSVGTDLKTCDDWYAAGFCQYTLISRNITVKPFTSYHPGSPCVAKAAVRHEGLDAWRCAEVSGAKTLAADPLNHRCHTCPERVCVCPEHYADLRSFIVMFLKPRTISALYHKHVTMRGCNDVWDDI